MSSSRALGGGGIRSETSSQAPVLHLCNHCYICQTYTSVKYKFSTSKSLYCSLHMVRENTQVHMCATLSAYTYTHRHTLTHLFLRIPLQSGGFYSAHAGSIAYTRIACLRAVDYGCVSECVDNHPHGRDIPSLTAPPPTPTPLPPPSFPLLSSRKAPILSLVALTQNRG